MTVKLARWSLHFYALPYRREIVWANAVEKQGTYALLMLEGDNGARGVAEGTIKATWSGVSPRSLKAAFEDFLMPRLAGVDIASPEAVALIKRSLQDALGGGLTSLLATEANAQSMAAGTAAHREAVQRFLTKQPPLFAWPTREPQA